jgi:Fe/S biogenesis protein NfuA
VGKAQPGSGLGRDHDPAVVHGHHGVHPPPPIQLVDGAQRGLDVLERHGHRSIAFAEHGCIVCAHDELNTERASRGQEVWGPVRGCRYEKKYPRHRRIMDHMSELTALLTITEPARERILEVRAGEPEPETLALWLEVSGVQGNAFTYDMYFRRLDEAGEQDLVQHGDDLSLVVPEEHADNIRGSTLDLSGGGLLLQNPNSPTQKLPGAASADLDLSDPIVVKVVEVLDTQINPQIAAHGGFAELVAIEVPIAYLRMGGGCQGCGMAAVTLSQGIEVALLDSVPEITEVVDVTDHASGANPYYEAAKK